MKYKTSQSNRFRWAIGALFAVILVILPLVSTPYINYQIATIGVYAVAILGLNVLTGYTGPISLGQSAFLGLGAYVAAITASMGWPIPIIFLASCLIPCVVGLVVALPAARLRGHSFAIVTIALPIIAIPLTNRFSDLTGGSFGITVNWVGSPSWSGLASDQWRYYVVAIVAALFFLFARNFLRGKLGRAFTSVRDNDLVASANGISSYGYRVLAFCISAAFAGGAGFLYVVVVQYVTPQTLSYTSSLYMVAALVIGGRGSVLGSLIGGIFFVTVPIAAGQISSTQTTLIYGVVLLAVLFLVPGGIVTLPKRVRSLRLRLRGNRPSEELPIPETTSVDSEPSKQPN